MPMASHDALVLHDACVRLLRRPSRGHVTRIVAQNIEVLPAAQVVEACRVVEEPWWRRGGGALLAACALALCPCDTSEQPAKKWRAG